MNVWTFLKKSCIPRCPLLVDLARRVKNVSSYGARLAAQGIDPATIWASTKAKKNQFYETYEKDHLDAPQPLRTDLENVLDGREFLDIEIPPG